MIPIYVDFIVSFAATVTGFMVLVSKMDVFNRKAYTPILESMIIFIGSLGWSVFALLSFAAVTRYPPWLADDDVWTGSWGYTCLLYTSPSPRDGLLSRMPSSA